MKPIVNDAYPLSALTGKVIGSAMELHRILVNSSQEVIYQRALAKEMVLHGLEFSRENSSRDKLVYLITDQVAVKHIPLICSKAIKASYKPMGGRCTKM